MFFDQTRPALEYGALLWANIAGILAIIFLLAATFIAFSIRNRIVKTLNKLEELSDTVQEKTLETMDVIQDAAYEVTESTYSISDIFNSVLGFTGMLSNLMPSNRKKSSFLKKIMSLLQ